MKLIKLLSLLILLSVGLIFYSGKLCAAAAPLSSQVALSGELKTLHTSMGTLQQKLSNLSEQLGVLSTELGKVSGETGSEVGLLARLMRYFSPSYWRGAQTPVRLALPAHIANSDLQKHITDANTTNPIEILDVSGCVGIETLDLEACSELKELKAVGCTGLTNLKFKGNKSLVHVMIDGSPSLRSIEGLNSLTNLELLWVQDCPQVEAIDLSGLRKIRHLIFGMRPKEESAPTDVVGLRDIVGIEKLKGLKELYLPRTQFIKNVSQADLQAIIGNSKDTFTEVSFSGAGQHVTSLDFSGAVNLQDLSLMNCEALNGLNLSGCKQLTKLNLEGCSKLETLNLSGCTALTSSLLNKILADCQKLKNLDLTGCTGLVERIDLQPIDLQRNAEFVVLNFEGCAALEDIDGINYCTNLETLSFKDCTKLDGVGKFFDSNLNAYILPHLPASLKNLDLTGCPHANRSKIRSSLRSVVIPTIN